MKINPRQIFISSHKKNILCRKILTCQVFTSCSVTSYESQKKKKKKKKGNTFEVIEGYDNDTILMNRALHEYFGHSGKCS